MKSENCQRNVAACWVVCSLALPSILSGCRQSEPDPYINRDLGEAGQPLLPVTMTAYSDDITKGSAQITRKDDFTPAPKPPADPAAAAKQFLGEVNKLIAERNFEELPKFIVEEQSAGAAAVFDAMGRILEAFDRFAAAADEKNPGTGSAIKQQMTQALLAPLDASTLVMSGPGMGEIKTRTGKAQVVFQGGYWYLKDDSFPPAGQVDAINAAADETVKRIDALIEEFKNNKVGAMAIGPKLVEAMKPMMDLRNNQ